MAIVVTGAAGFIGSCMVSFLNRKGRNDLILVDDFTKLYKQPNLANKNFIRQIERGVFLNPENFKDVEAVFHLGARTDTTEFDEEVFNELNLNYSKDIWNYCVEYNIPLIYASSAATYGDGESGFEDDEHGMSSLTPLNPYGESKLAFDIWAHAQEIHPPFWCGLKFFNVFGPNEYHKGRMASVVLHAFNQIKEKGKLKLFKSHRTDFDDGEQKRDFIYVKDLLELMWFWFNKQSESGVYNAGTGKAESFNTLAEAIFNAMSIDKHIDYIPTPIDIRDKYQYFTEAKMDKTYAAGFTQGFTDLNTAVQDYVQNYLEGNNYY